MRENRYQPKVEISPAWQALGGVLFVVALASPLVLMRIAGTPDRPVTAASEKTESIDGESLADAKPGRSARDEIVHALNDALIEPGRGIGPLRIGARYPLAATDDDTTPAARHGVHALWLGTSMLTVSTGDDDGRITAIELVAADCRLLERDQPRQDGLPSTAEAITLGTHLSRVRHQMQLADRTPLTRHAAGPVAQPVQQRYAGMTLDYCPESMLVRAIRVHPAARDADGAPLIVADLSPDLAAREQPDAPLALATPSTAGLPSAPRATRSGAHRPRARTEGQDRPSLPRRAARPAATPIPTAPVHWTFADPAQPVTALPPVALAMDGGVSDAEADGPGQLVLPESLTVLAAERSERSLGLKRAERRNVQLRLSLMGHDTQGVDGIFGPQTREAIRRAQEEFGQEPTGYLDAALLAEIRARTKRSYADWKARSAERLALNARRDQPMAARVPVPKHSPECRRNADGEIAENQSLSCDLALLEESLSALFSPES